MEIRIVRGGQVLAGATGSDEAGLLYTGLYAPGDEILFDMDGAHHAWVQLDQAIDWAQVYLPSGAMAYRVPHGEGLRAHPPLAFAGETHLIRARRATEAEVTMRRNLARNPADQRGEAQAYPHATANVETRGESVFAARNVIDGCTMNHGHGEWPYQSWGIGARTDAWLMLDFGREVVIDELVFYLRADFPHDAHWTRATVELPCGFEKSFPLLRTGQPQRVAIGPRATNRITLKNLIKSDDPSAFPALTQIEVYGTEEDT